VSFEVVAGPDGRHVVLDHGRRYVVPASLAARLILPDGQQHWRGLLPEDEPRRPGGRLLWARFTILPARAVRPIARRLHRLTAWPALACMVAIGLIGGQYRSSVAAVDAAGWLVAVALFLVSGLWHELGHAAALSRSGWAPGAVGGGLLILWPVMWSDVSCTTLLPRGGKVRVDVAGVCFQLGFVGLVGLVAWLLAWPPGALVVRAGWLAVAWSLLPVVRSDGHWLVCDMLGLEDVTAPAPARLGAPGRLLLACWRVATLLAMAGIVVSAAWRLVVVLNGGEVLSGPWRWPALALLAALGLLAAWRVGRRGAELVRAMARDRTVRP